MSLVVCRSSSSIIFFLFSRLFFSSLLLLFSFLFGLLLFNFSSFFDGFSGSFLKTLFFFLLLILILLVLLGSTLWAIWEHVRGFWSNTSKIVLQLLGIIWAGADMSICHVKILIKCLTQTKERKSGVTGINQIPWVVTEIVNGTSDGVNSSHDVRRKGTRNQHWQISDNNGCGRHTVSNQELNAWWIHPINILNVAFLMDTTCAGDVAQTPVFVTHNIK